ncbi:MAG: type II CAAX endopeptidase family protein [bacterium]
MRSLLKFFFLTYAVSWALWIGVAILSGGTLSPPRGLSIFGDFLLLIGVFAPGLVALALTARGEGHAGITALLCRMVQFPAQARWYIFAVCYFAVIKLTVALLHRIAIGDWPAFGQTPWFIMLGAIIVSTPVQAGEEIGWRGYALPRLAKRIGLARASIVLGVAWGCWHLPFFLIPGSDNSGQSFPVYVLAVTAISVAMAWLYWRTNGSLFLTMLLHAAVNNTRDILPSTVSVASNSFSLRASLVAWFTAALLWLCAIYFLVRMRGVTLQPAKTT